MSNEEKLNSVATQTISVDFNKPSYSHVFVKQGDSRTLRVELMDKGKKIDFADGMSCIVKFRKPDGFKVDKRCVLSDGAISVDLAYNMVNIPGNASMELEFSTTKNNEKKVYSTYTILVDIMPSAYQPGTIDAQNADRPDSGGGSGSGGRFEIVSDTEPENQENGDFWLQFEI